MITARPVWVSGTPQPQGSTRSFNHSRTGEIITLHANSARLDAWRNRITLEVRQYLNRHPDDAVPTGPLGVALDIYLPRPKNHSKARAAADRRWHYTRPDLDKLTRAVLDALDNANLFTDDAQVTELRAAKAYPFTPDLTGVEITWWPLKSPWADSRGGW